MYDYKQFLIDKDNQLADYATKNIQTIGFDGNHLNPDELNLDETGHRTWFRRDADKIRESKYFALLNYKTQIFLLPPEAITYRVRLTHTLTVSAIARTIAENLGLNTDLVEAISLGHDVGHTPCGHVIEEVISNCLNIHFMRFLKNKKNKELFDDLDMENVKKEFLICPVIDNDKHFQHGRQSYRLLTKFGKINLSKQVSFGIMRHSQKCYDTDIDFNVDNINFGYCSFEAQVVRIADDIAWVCHDFDDALKAVRPLIKHEEVLRYSDQKYEIQDILLEEKRFVKWINDVITSSKELKLEPAGWKKGQRISMSPKMERKWKATVKFIKDNIHNHPDVEKANGGVIACMQALFDYYIVKEKLTDYFRREDNLRQRVNNSFAKEISGDKDIGTYVNNLSMERMLCDYVSILPDRKFGEWHKELFPSQLNLKSDYEMPY